jgi:hypothetical protein
VSFDPHFGGGLSRFPPATYRDWLGTRTVTLYIVDTARPASAADQPTHSILQSSYSSSGPSPTPHIQ